MQMYRQPGLGGGLPQGVPPRVVQRLHADTVGDLQTAHDSGRGYPMDLVNRSVDIVTRDTGQCGVPFRVSAAEIGEPFVVNPQHFSGRLVVVQPHAGAEDAIQDLSLHPVTLLIFEPQFGISEAPDTLAAVVVETSRSHPVGAMDLARHVLAAGRTHPIHQAEVAAVLRYPSWSLGAVGDIRHTVL